MQRIQGFNKIIDYPIWGNHPHLLEEGKDGLGDYNEFYLPGITRPGMRVRIHWVKGHPDIPVTVWDGKGKRGFTISGDRARTPDGFARAIEMRME